MPGIQIKCFSCQDLLCTHMISLAHHHVDSTLTSASFISGSVNISKCYFVDNVLVSGATLNQSSLGGAVSVTDSSTFIEDSTFSGNRADLGGAVYAGWLVASASARAPHIHACPLHVLHCICTCLIHLFIKLSAARQQYPNSTSLYLHMRGSRLTDNAAVFQGGALYLEGFTR
jgi:hypothetical protein